MPTISATHQIRSSQSGISKQQFKAARRNSKRNSFKYSQSGHASSKMNITQESFAALMEQTVLENEDESQTFSMKRAQSTSELIATPLRYAQ